MIIIKTSNKRKPGIKRAILKIAQSDSTKIDRIGLVNEYLIMKIADQNGPKLYFNRVAYFKHIALNAQLKNFV